MAPCPLSRCALSPPRASLSPFFPQTDQCPVFPFLRFGEGNRILPPFQLFLSRAQTAGPWVPLSPPLTVLLRNSIDVLPSFARSSRAMVRCTFFSVCARNVPPYFGLPPDMSVFFSWMTWQYAICSKELSVSPGHVAGFVIFRTLPSPFMSSSGEPEDLLPLNFVLRFFPSNKPPSAAAQHPFRAFFKIGSRAVWQFYAAVVFFRGKCPIFLGVFGPLQLPRRTRHETLCRPPPQTPLIPPLPCRMYICVLRTVDLTKRSIRTQGSPSCSFRNPSGNRTGSSAHTRGRFSPPG